LDDGKEDDDFYEGKKRKKWEIESAVLFKKKTGQSGE